MSNHGLPLPASHRHARVLACVLCQHRKIKCDRNTPCSNCLKANVTCTPSTPAPARKRRRPNQDLQERLARCEELLKQYAGGSAPPPGDGSMPGPKTSSSPSSPMSPGDLKTESTTPYTPSSDSAGGLRQYPGKMFEEDGNVRFMDSYLWTSVYDELKAMRDIVDTDEPEDGSIMSPEGVTPDNSTDLFFFSDGSPNNVEDFQPDPAHVFRLWQLYLDRVNPIIKVVHVPTMQPYVMEAGANMESIPFNYQALLFAIYNMAVISLDNNECIQMLGMPRQRALQKFTSGTKMALMRFNFLKNHDMAGLQALTLYMCALEGRYDTHASWVLCGTIVRIAQKMGYHRDGELLNLTPFETEMRRRIWWQIIMLDSQFALLSGMGHSLLPHNWDTKVPQNVNDAELFPGSTEPVHARDGPTEMGFVLLIYHITKFKINADDTHDDRAFEAAILGQDPGADGDLAPGAVAHTFETLRTVVLTLERELKEIETRYIDEAAGNVHVAALTIRPMLTHKLVEMLVPMQEQPEWGSEIFNRKDNLFKVLIMGVEHNLDACDRIGKCFLWWVRVHFQLDVFRAMTGQLSQRPTGTLSDRAWAVMQRSYAYFPDLFDMTQKPSVTQAQYTLRAWKAREQAFIQAGQAIDVPQFILGLRECQPAHENRSTGTASATPPSMTQLAQPCGEMDSFMSNANYLDMSTFNWDMWGNMAANSTNNHNANANTNTDQLSAMFGGYGLNNVGNMS